MLQFGQYKRISSLVASASENFRVLLEASQASGHARVDSYTLLGTLQNANKWGGCARE